MLKEIHEQPRVIRATTEGRVTNTRVLEQALGTQAGNLLEDVRHVQIIACGTSYHAGMVARYWIEDLAGVPCSVEVASEFRYRKHVIQPGHPVPVYLPVRRNRRHSGCPAPGEKGRFPRRHGHLQRARQLPGAGI